MTSQIIVHHCIMSRKELKGKRLPPHSSLRLISYKTQDHINRDDNTRNWKGSSQSIIKKSTTARYYGGIISVESLSFWITLICVKLIQTNSITEEPLAY